MIHDASDDRRIAPDEWVFVTAVAAVILLVAAVPVIWGYSSAPDTLQFGGLIYNWQDGNSYLAKMTQGARGAWLYTVPFTSVPGYGVWLYPHYLLLGHIAAWFGIANVHLFNAARLVSGATLLFTLYFFGARFFPMRGERRLAYLVTALSGGFGWLVILFGPLYSDLLKAEIFPFLGILANPHFPLAMAALIWLVDLAVPQPNPLTERRFDAGEWMRLIGGTVILALMQPYGLVIAVVTGVLFGLTELVKKHRLPLRTRLTLMANLIGGLPYITYVAWVTRTQPALAGWDLQNVTISPPIWELAISFGLVLLFALPAIVESLRRADRNDLLLLYWTTAALVIMYVPYQQQRRFSLALAVPLGIFAVRGLRGVAARWPIAGFAFIAISNLSNLIVLLLIFTALVKFPPYLYFSATEWRGLMYLRANVGSHALVLASPDLGLYIPAVSGQRVIYGHPHETANARLRFEDAQSFFAGQPRANLPFTDALGQHVDYIFVGPREQQIGDPVIPPEFITVFNDGDTTIYHRR